MTTNLAAILLSLLLAGSQQSGTAVAPSTAASQASFEFTRVYGPETPGLVLPTAARRPPPLRYTPDALRARVQGNIILEITVGADGRVRDALVSKSLDAEHGMDEEAVANASEWVFEPAKLNGKAVAVRMSVNVTLTLQ